MRIQLLYFATARAAAGVGGEHLDVPDGCTLGDVVSEAVRAHPPLAALLPTVRFAVNEQMAERDRRLRPGDTVAVLPPFSGG